MKTVVPLSLALLVLAGCTSAPRNPEVDSARLRTETGVAGCMDCRKLKLFSSDTLDNQLYAFKSGDRIGASYQLGATNRKPNPVDMLKNPRYDDYWTSVSRGPYPFAGHPNTDATHPYRVFVRIHHNSSFSKQDVWLVTGDGKYLLLGPAHFDGTASGQQCFRTGCVWDADYVISGAEVQRALDRQVTLKVFVGDRLARQVASENGLDRSYQNVDAGVTFSIQPSYLRNFTAQVERQL